MARNLFFVFGVLSLVSVAWVGHSLEMTAGQKSAGSTSGSSSAGSAIRDKFFSSNIKKLLKCNNKSAFYRPNHPLADGDGCTPPLPNCAVGHTLVSVDSNGRWACHEKTEWYVGSWGACKATGGDFTYRHPDRNSSFGCAGVGWRNLKVSSTNGKVTISATNLRADYRWSGRAASATGKLGKKTARIDYAHRRDHTQLEFRPDGYLWGTGKAWRGGGCAKWYRLTPKLTAEQKSRTVECRTESGRKMPDSSCSSPKPATVESCS